MICKLRKERFAWRLCKVPGDGRPNEHIKRGDERYKDQQSGSERPRRNADPLHQPRAKVLEREGVRAITTSCGFLARYQRELASAVSVPVFTSSLLLVPLVFRMLQEDQTVGILTIDAASLSRTAS